MIFRFYGQPYKSEHLNIGFKCEAYIQSQCDKMRHFGGTQYTNQIEQIKRFCLNESEKKCTTFRRINQSAGELDFGD